MNDVTQKNKENIGFPASPNSTYNEQMFVIENVCPMLDKAVIW